MANVLPRTPLFSRKQPGGVFDFANIMQTPGDVWFVDSGHAAASDTAGFGQNPDAPTATIDYAIGLATASQGDVIYVMPGHNEAISAGTDMVVDKIGLSIIGLGRGMNRPILDFDNTAGSIEMDAASCRLSNMVFRASVASTVVAINVDADDCEIDNCFFFWEDTGDEFITCIDIDGVDRTYVHDNVFETELSAGASTEAIRLDDTLETRIEDNIFRGTWSASTIMSEGLLSQRLMILNNVIYNDSDTVYCGIDFGILSSTGIAGHNTITALYTQAGAVLKTIRGGDLTWHVNTFANTIEELAVGGHAGTTLVPAVSST
jgi:hypothetical protein